MGACFTLERDEEILARKRSKEIDRELEASEKLRPKVLKILLLGAGESGKSTLVKQMKIIHSDGFTQSELLSFRPTILDNLLSSMKYALAGMGILRINLEYPSNRIYAEIVLSSPSCFDMEFRVIDKVRIALKVLWKDRGVRLVVSRGYDFELNDSALYLFENMERILGEKYSPTSTDVLRARVRTNGIIETNFHVNDSVVSMYDVGGQRSQRRKWVYCFEDIRAVLFVVALSEYDMTLLEDNTVNRLVESLNLFEQIINNRWFKEAAFILFLNKLDLFREKIMSTNRHLRLFVPSYRGPDRNIDQAALFIQSEFLKRNHNARRVICPHFTTATDTANVQTVFHVVMETVLKENLGAVALL